MAILQVKLTSISDISNGTIIQLVEQVCKEECVKYFMTALPPTLSMIMCINIKRWSKGNEINLVLFIVSFFFPFSSLESSS